MELSTALENISAIAEKFAAEEIEVIRENREAAIPVLLQRVKDIAERGEVYDEDSVSGTYESYLLAEFRVNEAFEHLVSWLDYSYEYIEWLLSDDLSEGFPRILASCACPEDVPRLMAVASATEKEWSVRLAALEAITILYLEGELSKSDIIPVYDKLLVAPDDPDFLIFAMSNAMSLYLEEFFDRVRDLLDKGLADPYIMDRDSFEEFVETHDEQSALEDYEHQYRHFIRDSVHEMESWDCFDTERATFTKQEKKNIRELNAQINRGTKKKYKPKKKNKGKNKNKKK